jgi:hypothetical protein
LWGLYFEVVLSEAILHCKGQICSGVDDMFAHNDEVHWEMNFIILVHDWKVDFITFFFAVILQETCGIWFLGRLV